MLNELQMMVVSQNIEIERLFAKLAQFEKAKRN